MKTNYPLKSKSKHEHRGKIITVIILFVILSLFGFLFPNLLRTGFFSVSRSLWSVSGFVENSFVKTKNFFVFKNNLINSNTELTDEVSKLKLKQIDYDLLLQENQVLKNQLGILNGSSRIPARVLSKPPISPYDTFVVSSGSAEGVNIGSRVYLTENVLIGTISSVTSHTSIVLLFSSGSEKEDLILARTGVSYLVSGKGGGNLQVEVPKDSDILWGDNFYYPGTSNVVGSVYYIDTNSQSSFKTIYIRVPGNLFQVDWLFIE